MFYTEDVRTLTKYWIIFIVTFAVHNAEEAVRNLPEWAKAHNVFDPFASRTTFAAAVIVLTVAAAVTGYILERHKSRKSAVVLMIFCGIMIANALWHLCVSLYVGSVMPGAVSSIVMLPVFGWLTIKIRGLAKA